MSRNQKCVTRLKFITRNQLTKMHGKISIYFVDTMLFASYWANKVRIFHLFKIINFKLFILILEYCFFNLDSKNNLGGKEDDVFSAFASEC
jgi:hypothetical protein